MLSVVLKIIGLFYVGRIMSGCVLNNGMFTCDGMAVECEATDPSNDADKLPPGQYLIGPETRKHGDIGWYNLYPKRASGGYWDYHSLSPDHNCRGGFGLHEGTYSLGCITIGDSSCFDKIVSYMEKQTSKTTSMKECGRFGCRFGCSSPDTITRIYYTTLLVKN